MCSKSSRQVELVFECTYCSSIHYNKTAGKKQIPSFSQNIVFLEISWIIFYTILIYFIYEMYICRCACNVGEKTYTIHVNDGVIRLNRNGSERNQRGRGRVTLQRWLEKSHFINWKTRWTTTTVDNGGSQGEIGEKEEENTKDKMKCNNNNNNNNNHLINWKTMWTTATVKGKLKGNNWGIKQNKIEKKTQKKTTIAKNG